MRFFLVAAAYVVALILSAAFSFVAVLFLAGPHGGLLPRSFENVVLALAWCVVIVLPVLAARMAWRRSRPGQD